MFHLIGYGVLALVGVFVSYILIGFIALCCGTDVEDAKLVAAFGSMVYIIIIALVLVNL